MGWRVVTVTMIPPVLTGFDAVIRDAGHQPVALMTMRGFDGPDGKSGTAALLAAAPKDLNVLMPAKRRDIAPLLRSMDPDLVVCMGFPWKIPADALAVPKHGWLNGHPSLLPLHRGPTPVAWAIRSGDDEFGISFHRMDAELDTGPILVQRRIPFGEEFEPPDDFFPKTGPIVGEALAEALAKLGAGEEGTAQTEGSGSYETFFGDDDVWLDLTRPAAEVHRHAWAWRYGMRIDGGLKGALVELDGKPVRVLRTSLEAEGATCIECGDGSLWVVETEELSEEEATQSSAPAPSTP